MSENGSTNGGVPCVLEQSQYDQAFRVEQELLKKQRAARSKLETMRDTATFPDGDDLTPRERKARDLARFRELTTALNQGDWPAELLGPLDESSEPYHQYGAAEFVKCAAEVHRYWRQYHEALDATAEAKRLLLICKGTEAYKKWLRLKDRTSACNAECTSHDLVGQLCHHMLTAKRICPNHGQRPPAIMAA
jgi:hypothetical protein